MKLLDFRQGLSELMVDAKERPFVCDGSPLDAAVFVVGLNPATTLRQEFWSFWDDLSGFDRAKFDSAYDSVRATKRGNRPRIEAIASAFPRGFCLETNIYSSPTRSAPMLRPDQMRAAAFEFLAKVIQPRALFIHGAPTVRYFAGLNPAIEALPDDRPLRAALWGRSVIVMLRRRRALYTASCAEAARLGQMLAIAAQEA